MLITEPGAETAETADHLIRHQQDVARLADAGDFRPVGFRRHDDTAGALNGFGYESGDIFLAEFIDLRFQFARHLQSNSAGERSPPSAYQ